MRYYAAAPEDSGTDIGTNYFLYFKVLSKQLRFADVAWCPADTRRHYATNFEDDFRGDHISYFAGLDADKTRPNSFLCGDRNIAEKGEPTNGVVNITAAGARWSSEMHGGKGNVALANGSVVRLSNRELKRALESTGLKTNRLAMP